MAEFQLNAGQKAALEAMWEWWKAPWDPFILQGYAGTGKSSLLNEALNMFELEDYQIAGVTPTGKAAKIASDKSGRKFKTIHKFLYSPADQEIKMMQDRLRTMHDIIDRAEMPSQESGMEDQEMTPDEARIEIQRIEDKIHELSKEEARFVKRELKRKPRLIVVDEASMVSESIGLDLEELEIPIIYIGDNFQLPPVKAKCIWDGRKANAILTKIERQGEGSGIVYAAQDVRLGGLPRAGNGFRKHKRGLLPISEYLNADMVLVGTNRLRRDINARVRAELGYHSKYPQVGEKLICIRNDDDTGLTNGELLTVKRINFEGQKQMGLQLVDAFDEEVDVKCWKALFENDENVNFVPRGFCHLTYAYAITCHKSQGSEGKRCILLDSWPGKDWDRWTYTGITRAAMECDYITNQE